MNRDKAHLLDIFNAAQKIKQWGAGLGRSSLATNEEKQSAILYQIIIIGEAVKRLSPEFRGQHSSIPWRNIAGMRDIVSHQYDRLNLETLWNVVDQEIPELLILIEPLLNEPE